jgi:hypothetical protein
MKHGLFKMAAALAVVMLGAAGEMRAQFEGDKTTGKRLDIYGFAMLDMGYDFKQTNPDWFDVVRPTKLPSFENEFGKDGNFYAGVRQSRLGFKGYMPTGIGEVKTIFEFELFGTAWTPGRPPSACATPGARSAISARARAGARSWIPTSSPTRSSTGVPPGWCSSATSRCAGCR